MNAELDRSLDHKPAQAQEPDSPHTPVFPPDSIFDTPALASKPLPQPLAALEAADKALRCSHIKVDGVRCGSPALRGDVFCYFHARHFYYQQYDNQFQPLEDGNAIQLAIMQIIAEVRYNRMDHRVAKVLLYGLQTATVNLPHIKYDPPATSLTATPEYSHLPKAPSPPKDPQ